MNLTNPKTSTKGAKQEEKNSWGVIVGLRGRGLFVLAGAAAPRRSILEKRVRDAPRGRSWNGRGVGEYVRDFVSREGDASLAFFGGFG